MARYIDYELTFSHPFEEEAKKPTKPKKPKKKSQLGYYLFCIRWLWKNRKWENTRQKFKAMEREYSCK